MHDGKEREVTLILTTKGNKMDLDDLTIGDAKKLACMFGKKEEGASCCQPYRPAMRRGHRPRDSGGATRATAI